MNASEIAGARLHNQGLLRARASSASDVVRAQGAVQAQEYEPAKWGLSLRTRDRLVNADIERELTEGRIVRTHVMRPTWHFVAAEDLRWLLALTAPRVKATMASYNRKLELTPDVFRRGHKAIAKALEGGKHLTRTELRAHVEKSRVGTVTGQRLAHVMMEAELDALVCSGGRRGKQSTYALVDERVPAVSQRDRDDALVELTRRYFGARSPATAKDFAWWSGLAMADVKRGIEIAGRDLERIEIGDNTHWRSADAAETKRGAPCAHLLPIYDEYFIGFKDRSAIGERWGSAKLVTGGNALIANIVTIDGQIVGGWRRALEDGEAVVTLSPLARLNPAERQLVTRAGERFGRFLEQPVRLVNGRTSKAF
jgi:hypothetical protein